MGVHGPADVRRLGWIAWRHFWDAAVAAAIVVCFNSLFFRSFLPLPEGWFTVYAEKILRGEIPYRDFYLFIPPAHALLVTCITGVLGTNFLVLRVLGLINSAIWAWLLERLLRRVVGPVPAVVGAVVGVMMYETTNAFALHDYNDLCNTLVTGLALAATTWTLRSPPPRPLLEGLLLGVILITKHNLGILCLAAAPSVFFITYGLRNARLWAARAVATGIGVLVAIVPVIAWLAWNGAVADCIDQLFINRGEKGAAGNILVRWLPDLLHLQSVIGAVLVGLYFLLKRARPTRHVGTSERRADTAITLAALAAAALAPYVLRSFSWNLIRSPLSWYVFGFSHAGVFFATGVAAHMFATSVVRPLRRREQAWGITAVYACVFWFASAMSAGHEIPSYGGALGAALFTARVMELSHRIRMVRVIPTAGVLLLVAYIASLRFCIPYGFSPHSRWWGFGLQGDSRDNTAAVNEPPLAGLRCSANIANAVGGACSVARKYLEPGDKVFSYPHIPMFYTLLGRSPFTFSIVHWYDVASRKVLARDTQTVVEERPRVIIWLRYDDDIDVTCHEASYNAATTLEASRHMIATLEHMVAPGAGYDLVGEWRVELDCWLRVYVRR